ncbi:MAG: ribosomal protein S18-alanine N-acetyltransferase [Oscillospiraceae bacterium]|nr:ribosomal protein S18-alanine N-acetyltransferase [Oscillospiraceae bacterium]
MKNVNNKTDIIKVRAATADDVPKIMQIAKSALTPSWTENAVKAEIDKGDSLLVVAVGFTSSGVSDILGFAAFREVGADGELLQIAVDTAGRRKGTGSRLMESLIECANARCLTSIFLEVRISNEAAIGLYKKYDFAKVRIRRDYYSDPVEDAVVMLKKLV